MFIEISSFCAAVNVHNALESNSEDKNTQSQLKSADKQNIKYISCHQSSAKYMLQVMQSWQAPSAIYMICQVSKKKT